jgi:hypothetical protein
VRGLVAHIQSRIERHRSSSCSLRLTRESAAGRRLVV